jgi:hypothetical protein
VDFHDSKKGQSTLEPYVISVGSLEALLVIGSCGEEAVKPVILNTFWLEAVGA